MRFNSKEEFVAKVLELLPKAQFDMDNAGQIVIYTNLVQLSDGALYEQDDPNIQVDPNDLDALQDQVMESDH